VNIIIEYQYFANVYVYSTLSLETHAIFESYETYQKGGFRTRCQVIGSNGVIELRIPLLGGRTQKTLVKDLKMDFKENWKQSHFRTLTACYRRSPFFEFYEAGLIKLFGRKIDWLVDWDIACLEWVLSVLKMDVSVGATSSYQPKYEGDQYLDLRNKLGSASTGLPGIKDVTYGQVFSDRFGFTRGLSILDLLFCEGPNAVNVLKLMNADNS